MDAEALLDQLATEHSLSIAEYRSLILAESEILAAKAAEKACAARDRIYGRNIFIRGLIEISNICKNDCLYCGIRKSNAGCQRYRLSADAILACCTEGYALGFRTFVLQGGEDAHFTDDVLGALICSIKEKFPDCAVTLSLGERSAESCQRLFAAGADRYLLRHETANAAHYAKMHPAKMSFANRMECLRTLKAIGYQTGCGFMVGAPYQTADTLAQDLKYIETLQPAMCGIGPFIPHPATPFAAFPAGTVHQTCYLLSLLRLIQPNLLLPATTALRTLSPCGTEQGIQAGANVVMPNLSPPAVRKQYELYANKAAEDSESAQGLAILQQRIQSVGCRIAFCRGDIKII